MFLHVDIIQTDVLIATGLEFTAEKTSVWATATAATAETFSVSNGNIPVGGEDSTADDLVSTGLKSAAENICTTVPKAPSASDDNITTVDNVTTDGHWIFTGVAVVASVAAAGDVKDFSAIDELSISRSNRHANSIYDITNYMRS